LCHEHAIYLYGELDFNIGVHSADIVSVYPKIPKLMLFFYGFLP